ncbi:hypothetical protein MBLNU230_g1478t1 [Neophaeotheca triangularis]
MPHFIDPVALEGAQILSELKAETAVTTTELPEITITPSDDESIDPFDKVASAKKSVEILKTDYSVQQPTETIANLDKAIHEIASEWSPHVCVVGVGYVGEILLSEFGSVYPATGFDISEKRLAQIAPDFASLSNVKLTSSISALKRATHFCISVPTLLREDRSVNLDHLKRAIDMVTTHANPGSTIVIESSVSVGTTRALLGPYSDRFHCGMSPERVDPGRTVPAAHDIPKVISALTEPALQSMIKLYSKAFRTVVPVSKPEAAEMMKLFENCYRMINIAYVNEIADACKKQAIDVAEVIAAASTKPFGFSPFHPGLGVGGHCIPVNPFYIMANNSLPLLQLATENSWERPHAIAREFFKEAECKLGRAPRVLVVGMGFKPGQDVIDCSPAVAFAEELNTLSCGALAFHDPLVKQEQLPWIRRIEASEFTEDGIDEKFDCVAVCVKQHHVDFDVLDRVQKATLTWF